MAQIAMLAVGVLTVYPLYFIIITAFKTRAEYLDNRFLPPSDPTLENFRRAFRDGELLTWIGNSVMITIASVVVSTVGRCACRVPARPCQLSWATRVLQSHVALMVVPPVVLVVPLFLFFVDLGLINSRLSVIIIYAGLLVPFSVFLLVNFFATIPRSLEDAARIDGARRLRTLWSLILPLSAPAMVTIVVVNAVWVWNELLIALVFLQDNSARTLTAGLTFFQGRFLSDQPLVMTGALIAAVPMLVLYLVGQRFFIRGLTAGFGK